MGTGGVERHLHCCECTACLVQVCESFGGLTERLLGKTFDTATKSGRKHIIGWSLRHEILYDGQCMFGLANHDLGLGEQRLYQEWKIGRRKHLVQPAQSSHNTSRICSLEGQHHFGYSYLPEDVVIKHGTTTKNIVCLGKTGNCFI